MDENKGYFDNLSGGDAAPRAGREDAGGAETVRQESRTGGQQSAVQAWDVKESVGIPKEERGSGKGLFLGGLITGIAGALLIFAICYLGIFVQGAVESGHEAAESTGIREDSTVSLEMVSKLQLLEEMIKEYFYLEEPTEESLQDGMCRGLMEALGDPYTEYYSPEEFKDLMDSTRGEYYGVGAYISLDSATGLPKISGVMPGSPAEAAGLRANDLIYEVDGTSSAGMSLTEVTSLIKGAENTEVVITVVRENETDLLEIGVIRGKVEVQTVQYSALEDDMAYIQVSAFDDVTVKQFENALTSARQDKMQGLILDLRGNGGGSLDAVVDMCRMILPEGMIVYTEDKAGRRAEYTGDGSRELEVPLVLLVDGSSASASEIMAGAIKDYGIGPLVGKTTYGKGIVQSVIPLQDGSAVKITVSAYYTPKGNNIHGTGIAPDVECELDAEAYYESRGEQDNQLEKAKEVLRGKMR